MWARINTFSPRKCEPSLGSGEEMRARWGAGGGGGESAGGCGHALEVCIVARKRGPGGMWAVGVVRARGGVGTHWQPLNTL